MMDFAFPVKTRRYKFSWFLFTMFFLYRDPRGDEYSLVISAKAADLPGKRSAEHWIPALGLRTCRFVLNDIPVLDQNPVLHHDDVGRNPTGRRAETGKSSVNDYEVALGHNHVVLIFQRVRQTLDQREESRAARCDVRAVLNVIR